MAANIENTADLQYPHVTSGFSFENTKRNEFIKGLKDKNGNTMKLPGAFKTGTTICGVIFDGGVVLGADTRATSKLVVDKNCEKIHYIAPNIYCCGAGTAADTEMTTGQIASELELLRLGHVSAALVLGGVDSTGSHLYTVYPHGSTDKLPFVTMGSGSLAAMSVFESGYKDNLTREEAMDLVCRAIEAGIFNDLGSGSNVDLCIIDNGGMRVQNLRNYKTPNNQGELRQQINRPAQAFNFPRGTTPIEKEVREQLGGSGMHASVALSS